MKLIFSAQIVAFHGRVAAFIKGHAIDACEDLDFPRFPSDFDDERGFEEILFFNADPAETEFLKDFQQALGVRFADRSKEINTPRVSRKSIKADRVASHDEILNGLFFQ